MTNLEAARGRIKDETWFCRAAHICRYGYDCVGKSCRDCEFFKNTGECIKAMLAERKEPIKLTQWEKAVLERHKGYAVFNQCTFLNRMKGKGCFEGVADPSMSINDILNNCEVVER